jgi:hypothetical protein
MRGKMTNKIRHESITLYLPRDIVAALRSNMQGASAAAEEGLASWIIENNYADMKHRYCRYLGDSDIYELGRGEIAEAAQDDDTELVYRVLHGGSARALGKAGE